MKKHIILLFSLVLALSGCEIDESLNRDQKNPTIVPGDALFTNGTRNLFDLMNSCSVNENVFRLYAQYWAQTTYPDESQYNQITRNNGGYIWNTLYRDVLQDLKGSKEVLAEEGASNLTNKNAIISVMEVYAYSVLVDTFGDVPYTEALDPTNSSPKYDDAATIYIDLISKLNTAISDMSGSEGFSSAQDPIYNGDLTKWKKAATSLKLRMGLRLADVNASLAQQTVESISVSDLITTNDDNFGIQYLGSAPNTNPLWVSLVQSGRNDFIAANTYIDVLNPLNDPRRPFFFNTVNGDYVGGTYGSANNASVNSNLSDLMKTPDLIGSIITASEVNFLLAEAVERGYSVTGTAEAYYDAGVSTSILEWGGEQADVDTYLAQTEVAYTTAAGDWKQKIAQQKWIAMFNNGFEGWTTWRIFDTLTFNAPEGQTLADIPTRFLYPVTEATLNGTQLDAAAAAIGGDTKTTKVFWDAQ
ncbi:SusD-like starch-binding protein associating with outer membrane [Maribacter vaceletii]|uniref:SusD-like starch-binding protein associating with outer membrane n=1 Tax=Maribacter vaceletii TaxID=1206816 RepID=A0A495EAR9_9FLAO|nr:SusD/RagB family nutrient-binding outer membrane lipoprotein [Maribacter vaceletii]RKR14014.1 SusD-like starch-binding protein associating with outer membrane [Maribacter vaceletii]